MHLSRFCAAALLLAPAVLPSGARGATPAPGKTPTVKFTDYKLDNGLRVLLARDPSAPVVAVSVTYNVGSRNERPGRTGFAHLFEHLMFQGSEHVGRGEHFQLIDDNGGSFNGTTNQDRTNFFETLPANQLSLGLFLEADRMGGLDVSQSNLDNQRQVVEEEKRQRVDNQPYGGEDEALLGLAYSNFAYKHTTIGSMADLDAATLQDVREFYRTYYAPNNATLAVVGDFDVAAARTAIQKYFGPLKAHPTPPTLDVSEPADTGGPEKRVTLTDKLARLPDFTAAYKTVPGNDPDYPALSLLGTILGRGRTSRLYQALVETDLALNASGGGQESRGAGLFQISATLRPGTDIAPVEAAIGDTIAKIQQDGVTPEELARAQAQARVGAANRLRTALGRANALSQYAVFYNDPNRINTLLPQLQAVTTADVQRVAKKYLTPQNRVVVIDLPASGAGQPGGAAQ